MNAVTPIEGDLAPAFAEVLYLIQCAGGFAQLSEVHGHIRNESDRTGAGRCWRYRS